jgi:hypothetical protein
MKGRYVCACACVYVCVTDVHLLRRLELPNKFSKVCVKHEPRQSMQIVGVSQNSRRWTHVHLLRRPESPNTFHITLTLSGVSTCMKPLWG